MAKAKRSRLFFGMRNMHFETHDKDGKLIDKVSEENWKKRVIEEITAVCDPAPEELTFIFHDRDVDTDGTKKTLHLHFVVRFENPLYYDPTMVKFKCESRNFEKARSETSALLYLTHTTSEAIKMKKVRYNVSELNVFVFDKNGHRQQLKDDELEEWYRYKIAGREGSNKVSTDDDVARIIDELSEGLMTIDDVKDELKQLFDPTTATMAWMKNKRYFKEAVTEYYQQKYYDWLEHGRSFKLVYIQGTSGIGKTSFAREIGMEFNRLKGIRATAIHNAPNDTKGARYDFLSGYENEAVTVFDDLRANTFGYTEFLNLFEKERVSKYSSRFNDKAWFAELALITKSTSISKWTSQLSYSELKDANAGEKPNVLYQPRRRFSLVLDVSDKEVILGNYVLTDRKTMTHEFKEIKRFECPDKTEEKNTGFWEPKFQKKVIKAVMVALGFVKPTEADLKAVSVDEETVNKAEKLLAKQKVGGS